MDATGQVHVVDDDPVIRRFVSTVLESNLLPVALYESAAEFLANLDSSKPGCVLLDLKMPGMTGLEVLSQLRAGGVATPIIVMTGQTDVAEAVQCMKLGAVDVVQKPFSVETLVELVSRVLTESMESFDRAARQQAIRERFASLTRRELELVKHVVAGNSSKQIAAGLRISVKTVANHRAHLMAKVNASNVADLTRLATVAGIDAAA